MIYTFANQEKTIITNGLGLFIPCDPTNSDYAKLIGSATLIADYVAPPPPPAPPQKTLEELEAQLNALAAQIAAMKQST